MISVLSLGSMLVTIKALFSFNLDPSVVKQVFLDKTLNVHPTGWVPPTRWWTCMLQA